MIVDHRQEREVYGLFPISTKNYGRLGPSYFVSETHRDFHQTGLTESSYLYYETIVEGKSGEIRKAVGRFVNEMLKEVIDYTGLEP